MAKKGTHGWTPNMTGRSEQGRQVKCLIADDGWHWMPNYDRLPPVVRRRLSESRHNICAACMKIQAAEVAPQGDPSVKVYFQVIAAIERELDQNMPSDPHIRTLRNKK